MSVSTAARFASTASTSRLIHRAYLSIPGSRAGAARSKPSSDGSWSRKSVHDLHPGGPKKAGTGTLVKIRHEGFAGAPENAAGHAKGWERVLLWLEGYLERGETVDQHAAA